MNIKLHKYWYFFSLVPVLNKLPDHDNLPVFDDMLQFGTNHEYLYSYFGTFRVNQNNFHLYKIDLI